MGEALYGHYFIGGGGADKSETERNGPTVQQTLSDWSCS